MNHRYNKEITFLINNKGKGIKNLVKVPWL